jgi:hypothetical protein
MNESNRKQRYVWAAIVVVMLLLLFGLYRRYRADANLRQVRDLQKALAANRSPEQFQQFRDAMRKLSPDQRRRLFEDGRKRFENEIVNYTKMSREEKNRYLDRLIDRSRQFQPPPRNVNGFGMNQGQQRSRSPEERERRRRERLDSTSPEFRAAMDQFRKDMAARRAQRGLPPRGRA